MNNKKQFKPVLLLQAEMQQGHLKINLSVPMRWLAALAALAGVVLGSGP